MQVDAVGYGNDIFIEFLQLWYFLYIKDVKTKNSPLFKENKDDFLCDSIMFRLEDFWLPILKLIKMKVKIEIYPDCSLWCTPDSGS